MSPPFTHASQHVSGRAHGERLKRKIVLEHTGVHTSAVKTSAGQIFVQTVRRFIQVRSNFVQCTNRVISRSPSVVGSFPSYCSQQRFYPLSTSFAGGTLPVPTACSGSDTSASERLGTGLAGEGGHGRIPVGEDTHPCGGSVSIRRRRFGS